MKICIFAGNPKVSTEADGGILTETQPLAFREALKCAAGIRQNSGVLPHIVIGFDHSGSFSPFVKEGLSSKRRRSPRNLSDLKSEIQFHFAEAAKEFGIPLDDIHVIREGAVNSKVRERMASNEYSDQNVHCELIATEFLRSAIGKSGADELIVFHENATWSDSCMFVAAKSRLQDTTDRTPTTLHVIQPK
jgi:hypothetical protein